MPDLLLSSAPKKDATPNVMVGLANHSSDANNSASLQTESELKQRDGFTSVLSSVVNKTPNNDPSKAGESAKAVDDGLKELGVLVEGIQDQLIKLDPESELFQNLSDLLNGNELSLEALENSQHGANLPDILSQLQRTFEDASELIQANSDILDADSLDALNIAFTQGIQAVQSISGTLQKTQHPEQFKPSLFGFAFNNENGQSQNNNWQKYDPQLLSQSNLNSMNANGVSLDDALNNPTNGITSQHLMSKTDQSFQVQMDQIMTGHIKDASSLVSDSPLNSLIDVKEKPSTGFSDLQLRTPGESLKQYSTTLSTPVNAQDWGEEVSQKIVWFTGRNIQTAEMHLNPAELGPIDVKIHVQNDVATVSFNVNNASVRDLLESNVVRLREMMEANGVSMGDVNVDSGSQGQSNESGGDPKHSGFAGSGADGLDSLDLEQGKEQIISVKETNLVDYFV